MALPSSRNKGLSRFYTAHMLWIRMGRVLILCTRGVCNAFMCSSAWLTNWLMDWLAVAGLTYSCGARGRLSGWFIGVLGECRSCVWPWRERGRTSNGLAHSGIAEQWETAAVLPGVEHFLSHCLPWTLTDRTQLHASLCHHNTKLLTQTHIITHTCKATEFLKYMRDSLFQTTVLMWEH